VFICLFDDVVKLLMVYLLMRLFVDAFIC